MKTRFFLAALACAGAVLVLSQVEGKEDPTKILTLDSAIQTAAQNNPELKALEQDVAAAKAKVSRARYWEDPMIGVRFYQVPFEGGFDETQDIDYIVRQKFPIGGKAKAMSKMAYHDFQARFQVLQGKELEILRDLKMTYYGLFAVQRMIAVSREIEGNFRGMVKNALSRVATDQVMASDASLGQAEIAKILQERQALFQQQRELEAKLKQLMSVASPAEFQLPSKLEVPDWQVDIEELLQVAQQRHPAIQGESQSVEAREWGLKAAKKEFIPDIQFQAEYVQRPGGRVDAFTGEMMLNVPLIVHKKNQGVKQAEAELASAQFMKQNTQNSIIYRIRETFSKLQTTAAALAINHRTFIPQARQAYQMTSQAYSSGKVGFVEVLSALRMLFEAQMNYWKTFENHAASVFELEAAVGLPREEWNQIQKE